MVNEKSLSLLAQKEELDKFMGENRNEDQKDAVIEDFADPRVCKFYLLGFCPYTMFKNTKEDLGTCPSKVCNAPQADRLKKKYEEVSKKESFGYETLLLKELQRLMNQLDRKIEKYKRRLEEQGKGTAQNMDLESKPEMMELTRQIEEKVKKAEEEGEEGNVEESEQLMNEADELKKQKAEMQAQLMRDYEVPPEFQGNNKQMLRVCEVCAAYLSSKDSDERLAEHFAGKTHMGYLKIRSKIRELKEQLLNEGYDPDKGILPRPKYRRSPSAREEGGTDRDRERERGRDGERGRDRDRRSRDDRDRKPKRERSPRRSRDDDRDGRRRKSSRRSRSRSSTRRRSRGSRSRRRSRSRSRS